MIKLPKEIVEELVTELKTLLEKRENTLTREQLEIVKHNNKTYLKREEELVNKIKELEASLAEVRLNIIELPEEETVDEDRINEITQMLVLSGYYTKVIKADGEYLEETGFYEETPVTAEQEETEEEEILKIETIEEVVEEEEDLVDPADKVEIIEEKVIITEEQYG